ncbi:DNA independent RNA polymerase I transcription factor [Coemansia sp. RSA 1939]|nr:DNA independent RNA polymerase I transcription factor [Coemansia sp. RSA 1939]KAJ2618326.1 DNA independent RNA polymerase I transcription factor [Coemansia sp. RSA 1804]
MPARTESMASRPIKRAVSKLKKATTTQTQKGTVSTNEAEQSSPVDGADSLDTTAADSGVSIDKSVFLRKFVENALQQFKEGNPEEYYKLVKVFTFSKYTSYITVEKYVEEVTPWIPAVSANISALGIAYRELVTTIFSSDWVVCSDEQFVHRYATLCLQILSAHPTWVPQAISAFVRWFTYGARDKETAAAPMVHDHLHALVKEIYCTIPTCGTSLAAALVDACPFKAAKPNVQVLFVQNALRCLDYATGIRRQVLQLVLNYTIQIDVEVQVELEDLESESEDEDEDEADNGAHGSAEEGIFEFEEEEDTKDGIVDRSSENEASASESGSDSESESGSDSGSDSEYGGSDDLDDVNYNARKAVVKLDAVMSTLFTWLEKNFQRDTTATDELPESAFQLYLAFLDLFNVIVLPTFKSRYTQFLLFFLCSRDPQYADVFLGTMMGNVGEPIRTQAQDKVSSVTKVAAASYLGSFVARAKFLTPKIVRSVVGVLVQWANAYLDWQEQMLKDNAAGLDDQKQQQQQQKARPLYSQVVGGSSGPTQFSDFERHAVFYAVTQAILYMFCFRWRDLAEASGGGPLVETELDSLHWCHEVEGMQRVVFSKLNPLRACAPAVAQQFASVSSQTNFMFCYVMLQQNRRSNNAESSAAAASSTTNGGGVPGGSTSSLMMTSSNHILRVDLDTFFPFDPMALPISRNFIDPIYFEWKDVGSESTEDEESDEEDNGEKDDETNDNEAGVVDQMIAMSISPITPLSALPGGAF